MILKKNDSNLILQYQVSDNLFLSLGKYKLDGNLKQTINISYYHLKQFQINLFVKNENKNNFNLLNEIDNLEFYNKSDELNKIKNLIFELKSNLGEFFDKYKNINDFYLNYFNFAEDIFWFDDKFFSNVDFLDPTKDYVYYFHSLSMIDGKFGIFNFYKIVQFLEFYNSLIENYNEIIYLINKLDNKRLKELKVFLNKILNDLHSPYYELIHNKENEDHFIFVDDNGYYRLFDLKCDENNMVGYNLINQISNGFENLRIMSSNKVNITLLDKILNFITNNLKFIIKLNDEYGIKTYYKKYRYEFLFDFEVFFLNKKDKIKNFYRGKNEKFKNFTYKDLRVADINDLNDYNKGFNNFLDFFKQNFTYKSILLNRNYSFLAAYKLFNNENLFSSLAFQIDLLRILLELEKINKKNNLGLLYTDEVDVNLIKKFYTDKSQKKILKFIYLIIDNLNETNQLLSVSYYDYNINKLKFRFKIFNNEIFLIRNINDKILSLTELLDEFKVLYKIIQGNSVKNDNMMELKIEKLRFLYFFFLGERFQFLEGVFCQFLFGNFDNQYLLDYFIKFAKIYKPLYQLLKDKSV